VELEKAMEASWRATRISWKKRVEKSQNEQAKPLLSCLELDVHRRTQALARARELDLI